MKKDWNRYSRYAPFLVRIGLGLVLVWFGVDALINPGVWASLVPSWILKVVGVSAKNSFMNYAARNNVDANHPDAKKDYDKTFFTLS